MKLTLNENIIIHNGLDIFGGLTEFSLFHALLKEPMKEGLLHE